MRDPSAVDDDTEAMSTHPALGPEYRKTATVFARQVEEAEAIEVSTLEGPAVARRGDYVVTANTPRGEQWVVEREVFEATYERVDD